MDFDKKLAETDAYLQILIDQVKVALIKHHCQRFKRVIFFILPEFGN
jgi:hypothetical protein